MKRTTLKRAREVEASLPGSNAAQVIHDLIAQVTSLSSKNRKLLSDLRHTTQMKDDLDKRLRFIEARGLLCKD